MSFTFLLVAGHRLVLGWPAWSSLKGNCLESPKMVLEAKIHQYLAKKLTFFVE